jgi:acetolactate synthase-1/2/3 large subunit
VPGESFLPLLDAFHGRDEIEFVTCHHESSASLAAALRHLERKVVAFCGDGGFLMTGNEPATAVGRKLDVKIVISNNRSYSTIRSYQEKAFPHRVSGTDLTNPYFAAVARAFGGQGYAIAEAAQAAPTVAEAMAEPGPAVIEILCDVRQTHERSLAAARQAALTAAPA